MGVSNSKDLPVPLDVSPGCNKDRKILFFPNNDCLNNISDGPQNSSSDNDSKEDSNKSNSSSDSDSKEDSNELLNNINTNLDQLVSNNQQLEQEIEKFVEEWFSSNENVDLGNIEILNQKIDLIPDSMEKMIYKKALMISVTFLKKILEESQITFLNQEIKLTMRDK